MPATIVGDTSLTWGLTPETGMIAESFSQENSVKEKAALDEQGEEAAVSFYGESEEISLSGFLTTGAKDLTAALTVANQVGSGTVYQTNFRINGANEDFQKVDITAKGWVNIS